MAETYTGFHPFAYDNNYYLYAKKEEAEKEKFISFMKQRDAKYKDAAEEEFNAEKLEEEKLFWESYRGTIEVPTPQIKEIDGYSPEDTE